MKADKPGMTVIVRQYTERDLPALAEAHLAAYRGYMNAGIGARYVRAFLRYFLTREDAVALMAEVDGQAAGYAAGLPVGQHQVLNKALLPAYAIGAMTHPWVLLRPEYRRSAVAKLKRILGSRPVATGATPSHAAPAAHAGRGLSLTSIAVSPTCAGRGAASALLREFEQQARERRFDYVHLSVYDDNSRARAVYERAGWIVVGEPVRIVVYQKDLNGASPPG